MHQKRHITVDNFEDYCVCSAAMRIVFSKLCTSFFDNFFVQSGLTPNFKEASYAKCDIKRQDGLPLGTRKKPPAHCRRQTIYLLFVYDVQNLRNSVEVVPRIIVYVNSALLVVAYKADLGTEGKPHTLDKIFELY